MARARERTVTAVMGEDGRVYFEFQRVAKPSRLSLRAWLPDLMSVALSVMVASVVVALALLI